MNKLFSKITILALVVGLFFVPWAYAIAPAGTMSATLLQVATSETKAINTITVLDSGAEITVANDIRIRIPNSVNAEWDTTDTAATVNVTGTGVVSGTVSYPNDRILLLDVTTVFGNGDSVTIADLNFVGLLSATPATDLDWSVDGGSTYSSTSSAELEITEGFGTTTSTINVSPAFGVTADAAGTPSDGGSHSGSGAEDTDGNPTANGSNVTFTAKATDANGDAYFLAVCGTDAVVVGALGTTPNPPTCAVVAATNKWAISASTATTVEASVTYQAGSNSAGETANCTGTDEVCGWYAFVCDDLVAASNPACYPADAAGDQGLALGTIEFADVPADEDDITVDSVQYRFGDPTCAGGGTCVDISSAEDGNEAAAALVAASTALGDNTHMIARGDTVFVYEDAKGTTSVTQTKGICANCTMVPDGTLVGGDTENADPFYINHVPTITSVVVGSATGSNVGHASGSIAPGDTLYFSVLAADVDVAGGQDTIAGMYVCSGETRTGGNSDELDSGCTNGTVICSDTAGRDPTSAYLECSSSSLVATPPIAHATDWTLTVYIVDNHGAKSASEDKDFTVIDAVPILDTTYGTSGYSASDTDLTGDLVAGDAAGTSFTFTAGISDANGDGDTTGAVGLLFEDDSLGLDCTEDENDCYSDGEVVEISGCAISDNANIDGGGMDSTGTDLLSVATCTVTVYFNATASTNWELQIQPTDEANQPTDLAASNLNIIVPAVSGINIDNVGTIAYGTVAIGGTSGGKKISMGNVGNQIIDVLLEGDNMCTDYPGCAGDTIGLAYQKWYHEGDGTFDWDTTGIPGTNDGPFVLQASALAGNDSAGCLDRAMAVRNDHTDTTDNPTTGNEVIYWKIRIPEGTAAGSFTGANTFASTATDTCSGGTAN